MCYARVVSVIHISVAIYLRKLTREDTVISELSVHVQSTSYRIPSMLAGEKASSGSGTSLRSVGEYHKLYVLSLQGVSIEMSPAESRNVSDLCASTISSELMIGDAIH